MARTGTTITTSGVTWLDSGTERTWLTTFVVPVAPELPMTANGHSVQDMVMSEIWPVPMFQMMNGRPVAAGGISSSSPSL
jgi:hypothetical protein